jgi:hypothetical protein
MKIAQVFTHAIVRRIAYVIAGLLLAWCGIGRADAQTVVHSSREEAYQHCMADKAQTQAYWSATGFPGTFGSDTCSDSTASQMLYRCTASQTESAGMGRCVHAFIPQGASCSSKACVSSYHGAFQFTSDCPANKPWNPVTKTCFDTQQCSTKPALGNAFTIGGSGTTCVDGCQFAPTVSVCANGVCSVSGAKPTGQACGTSDQPPQTNKDQQCTPAGSGQTYCVKADGQQCYTASAGRQVCWRPGETGEKPDQDTLQKRDAGTEPVSPNVNLPNNDTLTPKGPPVVSNTQVKDSNGTRNITTVTQNYGTTNGTNAGSGNSGENGDGTGGTGSGPGEGDGEGDEPGQPGDGVGTGLYEGSGKTVSSVMSNFMQQAQQSPLIGAAGQFMGNCSFGGSCPNWSYDGGEMMGNVSFDLCNPALASLYGFAGALVMALAAFCAFRIAIY